MSGVTGGSITLIAIVIITLFILSTCIRIVPQAQALVVKRLGTYLGTYSMGTRSLVPLTDHVVKKVNLKEQMEDFPPQPVITRDNVIVWIDTVVLLHIMDPKLYAYGVEHPLLIIESLTVTTLRNIIGDLELDETLISRETTNAKMQGPLDTVMNPWGIEVTRVKLKNIIPLAAIQEAMEKQMEAERECRESVLRAEGEERSMILVTEGNKEFAVLNVEAEREAVILRAKAEKEKKIKETWGQAEVIRPVQKAMADDVRFIEEVRTDNVVLQFKSLEVFQAAASRRVNKITTPPDTQGITGPVKSTVEVVAKDEAAG